MEKLPDLLEGELEIRWHGRGGQGVVTAGKLLAAATTTSPAGSVLPGKGQYSKDLTAIVAAHNIPYLARRLSGSART